MEEPKLPNRTNQLLLKIAATVVILLGVTWFYSKRVSEPRALYFTTLVNEQKELTLPDQSKVFLNSNTTIAYPEIFKGDAREIKLEGEAYFEIANDVAHPFIVHTENAYSKITKASFNVLARKNSGRVVVSVKSGKVEVAMDGAQTIGLEQRYAANVILNTKSIEKVISQSENYLSWKTKELIFTDATIEELIVTVENYFEVKITANVEILGCRFTGKFKSPNLTEILNVLELSNGIQYEIKGTEISLRGNPCLN